MKRSFVYPVVFTLVAGCSSSDSHDPSADYEKASAAESSAAPVASVAQAPNAPLGIKIVKPGRGKAIKSGQTAVVHYTGWLTNGKQFDSSRTHGKPFSFHLGAGEVIPGWDQGVVGMKVGEKRKLTIPPDLGYGDRDSGPIPANSTLLFDVELVAIK